MTKLFFITILLYFPILLILCGVTCGVARWCLSKQNTYKLLRTIVLLCGLLSVVGIIYGILRFSGVIIFSSDNYISYNWFDSSYRDDGYQYISNFSSVLAGIVIAYLLERKKGTESIRDRTALMLDTSKFLEKVEVAEE